MIHGLTYEPLSDEVAIHHTKIKISATQATLTSEQEMISPASTKVIPKAAKKDIALYG